MQEVFEKIIENIKQNAYMVVQKNNSKELGMTLRGIEQAIQEVSEQYNNGWVPCSERLPNQDGEFTDVLITCVSMSDGVFVQSAEFYVATDGSPVFDALYHYERVLAWQPLQEPYKEQ